MKLTRGAATLGGLGALAAGALSCPATAIGGWPSALEWPAFFVLDQG